MELYIGTNYHPHDWPPERWPVDIRMMKAAGLDMVRLGHLCWDSYEPEEGVYTFEWFDDVMNQLAEERQQSQWQRFWLVPSEPWYPQERQRKNSW